MKINILYSLLIISMIFASCKSKRPAGLFKAELEISTSQDYCGGAPPSPEIMRDIVAPRIHNNKKIYFVIKNEDDKVVSEQEFTTDSKGRISVYLAPGMYHVYLNSVEQRKQIVDSMEAVFRECSADFMNQAPGQFHIFADMEQKLNLHTMCNPCLPPAP